MYTNAKILNIDNQTFIAYLDNLEKEELICKKSNEKNDASTLNYIATVKGTNLYKDKKFDKLIGSIANLNLSLLNVVNL